MTDICAWALRRIEKLINFVLNIVWAHCLWFLVKSLMFLLGKEYRQMMYGEGTKASQFCLDMEITTVNHGSYGSVPRKVQKLQRQYQNAMEQSPDVWFRHKVQPLWEQALRTVADFVGAKFENIVFVPNATFGVNIVLRSLDFSEAAAILVTNQTYGAVHMTAREVCQASKAKLLVLNITYPTVDFKGSAEFYVDDVVEHYSKVLQENSGIQLAVIDYIASASALLFPVSELVSLCHKHNVAVLIDGAHAPGQVQLNLEELGADFFIGELHKWVFAPRGCAVLLIHPKYHDVIEPLVVSWNHGGSLHDRFFQQGTLDYTSFVTAEAAIKFYQDIGGLEMITSYNQSLVTWASSKLAADWNTEVLPVPSNMRAPFMASVRLPDAISTFYGATSSGAAKAKKDIFTIYGILVTISYIQSSLWCRVSAQVYNTREDYVELSDAVRVWKKYILTERLPDSSSLKANRHSSWFTRSSLFSETSSD